MSGFRPYPAYKDSGVEWLGEVPEHWKVLPVKSCGWLKAGAGFPHDKQGFDALELDFHKVNALATASREGYLLPSENTVSRDIAKELGAYIFPVGSIVFAKVGAALLLARVRRLNSPACIDNNMMGLVVFEGSYNTDFVLYAMAGVRFDFIANPGAVPSLNESQIGNYRLAIPPQGEQTQIAQFLDHETARIDALIEEQQRLIELLKEKRQALISHAVTKGLDPTVPMKDSGVEWLGEVPAHWSLPKLGHLARVLNGSTPSRDNAEYWLEGDVPWVASSSLNDYRIDSVAEFITKKALGECSVEIIPRGSVLVGLVGQGRTRGLAALLNIEATINQNVCAVVPDRAKVLSGFLHLYLHSIYEALRDFGRGANQAALNCELVSAVRIPLPSLEEQRKIVHRLEKKLDEFDTLERSAQHSIELMQERRSALISAAVTGKIDVRNWQPSAEAPELEHEPMLQAAEPAACYE